MNQSDRFEYSYSSKRQEEIKPYVINILKK